MKPELNHTEHHYRDVRLGAVRLLCVLSTTLFILFMAEDWFISRHVFYQLLIIKVFAIPTFVALFIVSRKAFAKSYSEVLVFLTLFTVQVSAYFHTVVMREEILLPFVCLLCTTFSASVVPWRRRWHMLVLMVSIVLVFLNLFHIGTDLWPFERVYFLAVIFMLLSVPLLNYSTKQNKKFSLMYQMLFESEQESSDLAKKLAAQARTDFLTGAENRRGFFLNAEDSIAEVNDKSRFVVAFIDLDHFKSVNDRYGHAVGDEVLKRFIEIAQVFLEKARGSEFHLSRIGGEEFALQLSGAEIQDALSLIEDLRQHVSDTPIHVLTEEKTEHIQITVSIGVSKLRDEETDVKAIMARCDRALYVAKNAGRNNVKQYK